MRLKVALKTARVFIHPQVEVEVEKIEILSQYSIRCAKPGVKTTETTGWERPSDGIGGDRRSYTNHIAGGNTSSLHQDSSIHGAIQRGVGLTAESRIQRRSLSLILPQHCPRALWPPRGVTPRNGRKSHRNISHILCPHTSIKLRAFRNSSPLSQFASLKSS